MLEEQKVIKQMSDAMISLKKQADVTEEIVNVEYRRMNDDKTLVISLEMTTLITMLVSF